MTDAPWPTEDLKRRLAGPGPKRILALDGGGVRGMLTVGMLQRMEEILEEQSGRGADFRLRDYFDLIAGTSTGSIIATLLALGKRVSEIRDFYDTLGPKVFAKAQAVGARKPKFSAAKLESLLEDHLGDLTIGAPELTTGLMICAKRMDTGSQWVISNDARGKYYQPQNPATFPNRHYLLRNLIRASTAAPYYFDPVKITIADHPDYPKQVGMFVDGGVGGDNNPSLQAFKSVTLPGYNMNWPTGKDQIFLVSLGTGWRKPLIDIDRFRRMWNWEKAKEALSGMIQESVQQNIVTLQAMAHVPKPWYINRELLDMQGMRWLDEPLLTYHRWDASLEDEDVIATLALQGNQARNIGIITDGMLQIDNASRSNLSYLYALGHAVGSARADGAVAMEAGDFPGFGSQGG